jgi:hypothetical protein
MAEYTLRDTVKDQRRGETTVEKPLVLGSHGRTFFSISCSGSPRPKRLTISPGAATPRPHARQPLRPGAGKYLFYTEAA